MIWAMRLTVNHIVKRTMSMEVGMLVKMVSQVSFRMGLIMDVIMLLSSSFHPDANFHSLSELSTWIAATAAAAAKVGPE